jgi:hypothetical protein
VTFVVLLVPSGLALIANLGNVRARASQFLFDWRQDRAIAAGGSTFVQVMVAGIYMNANEVVASEKISQLRSCIAPLRKSFGVAIVAKTSNIRDFIVTQLRCAAILPNP